MPAFFRTRKLQIPAATLFAVIADVERYPEFLRGIQSIAIIEARDHPAGIKERDFSIAVSALGLTQEATGRVILDEAGGSIKLQMIAGPFERFRALFLFEPDAAGTVWTTEVDCRFRNPVVGAIVNPIFDTAMRKILAAFVRRAEALAPAN
jgi:coenzyme Q-binding protein COQ10